MVDHLTKEYFAERVGLSFRLELAGQEIELELAEVKSLGVPSAGSQPQRESFSLVFRGPQNSPLDQGMFTLSQSGMDDLEPIFLVPIAADEQGRYYEAIFN
jgi:hypothetical protein